MSHSSLSGINRDMISELTHVN